MIRQTDTQTERYTDRDLNIVTTNVLCASIVITLKSIKKRRQEQYREYSSITPALLGGKGVLSHKADLSKTCEFKDIKCGIHNIQLLTKSSFVQLLRQQNIY